MTSTGVEVTPNGNGTAQLHLPHRSGKEWDRRPFTSCWWATLTRPGCRDRADAPGSPGQEPPRHAVTQPAGARSRGGRGGWSRGGTNEFWDHYYPGFSVPFRDLGADDVLESTRRQLRSALARMRTPKRSHLVIKITGWPRVGFLREIFPEGRFVHVVRDGRAVASSLLKVPWWWGWRDRPNWRWGPLTPELDALWAESGRSFVALAAIQWRILMEATVRELCRPGSGSVLATAIRGPLRRPGAVVPPRDRLRRACLDGQLLTGGFGCRDSEVRTRSGAETSRRDNRKSWNRSSPSTSPSSAT